MQTRKTHKQRLQMHLMEVLYVVSLNGCFLFPSSSLAGEEDDADASLHPEHQRGCSAVRGGEAFHPGGLVHLNLSVSVP